MAKERGFAVVSGSSTVVARIMENGTAIFGQDKPINLSITGSTGITGSLNIKLDSGEAGGTNKVLFVGSGGETSIAQLSASAIAVQTNALLTSSNVQNALVELQNEINTVSMMAGGTTLTVSSSNGQNGLVNLISGALILSSSDPNLTVSGTAVGNNVTVGFDFSDSPTFVNITATSLSASGQVSSNTLSVSSNATVGGDLTVAGNLTVQGNTTLIDTTNLLVEDKIIVLGSSSAASANGDTGFIFQQASSKQAFGMDNAGSGDFTFKLGSTTSDPSGSNLDINADGTLKLGTLSGSLVQATTISASLLNVSTAATIQNLTLLNGLTVTGAVNLPNGSINNNELEFSSIELTLGSGIAGTSTTVSLGGTGSISLDLSELPTVTVDVGNDKLAIVDASNSNSSSLVTFVGLASATAGTGLTATSGVLSVNYGSTAGTAVQGNTVLTVSGTSGEIEVNGGLFTPITLGTPTTVTIGLPDNITVTSNLTVGGNLIVSGNTTLGTGTEDTITVVGNLRHPIFSVSGANAVAGFPTVPAAYVTNAATYGGYSFYLTSSATTAPNGVTPGSGSWNQANKWYFNENGEWYASFFIGV